jgi:hypothetical protein
MTMTVVWSEGSDTVRLRAAVRAAINEVRLLSNLSNNDDFRGIADRLQRALESPK